MSVFVEERVTTTTRACINGCPIYQSDPVVRVAVSPWAYGPSTGSWEIIQYCGPCGRHSVRGAAA